MSPTVSLPLERRSRPTPASARAPTRSASAALPAAAVQQAIGNRAAQSRAAGCAAFAACPTGGACHACPLRVQAKLAVSAPGDRFEREADRLADSVPWQPVARAGAPGPSPSPLSEGVRTTFEPVLGRDLGGVRVHTGPAAAAAARAIGARAFTAGSDISFAEGEYRPDSATGMRLLAHELVHVDQQSRGGEPSLFRQVGATPTFGPACSTGASNPCQRGRCSASQQGMMPGALAQALRYVDGAIASLGASPLADATSRALRWYFADDSGATATAVRERLECIRGAIVDTQSNARYGCHPGYGGNALAYVCVGGQAGTTASAWTCADEIATICITEDFPSGARARAEVLIHEHAHRIGLSAGSHPDIYRHHSRFPFMATEESLMNSDSISLFAGAITEGVRVSWPLIFSIGGGGATPLFAGTTTWLARMYIGTELQHPVLGVFNPTLGLGFTVIGEPAVPGATRTPTPTALATLVGGIRIGSARPGAAPTPYVSLFGGPSVAVGARTALGAEAGLGLGVRWRWIDFSVSAGYAYDPARAAGLDPHLLTGGATITFIPQVLGTGY